MALVNRDRVLETSTTTGTGTYTLAGAVTGYQSFSAIGNANTCYYSAWEVDGSGNPSGGWEVGLGTYTASGTTLARTSVIASSNGGAAVNWTAGTRRIAVVLPASGTLVVRQPGGTAGTDEVQISHDGTNGKIAVNDGGVVVQGTNTPGGSVLKFDRGSGNTYFVLDVWNGFVCLHPNHVFGWASGTPGSPDTAVNRAGVKVVGLTDGSSAGAALRSVPLSPSQITADQNNYAPGVAWFYRLSTDASRTLTGLSTGQVNGQLAEIWNVGSNNLVLANESASSTATNRFTIDTGADFTIAPNKTARLRYDSTTSRWRVWGDSTDDSPLVGIQNFRLTTESGVPVSTSDRTSQSTLYLTPYIGNQIALYDGSTTWTVRSTTEISLALSGLTSGKNYDVFAYWTGSAVALELSAAWTNDTTRADALTTQSGVYVKSGATTRRLVGTIRTTGTTTTEDSATKRFVWNASNRVWRHLLATDSTDSWTYSSLTWRQARASSANQVEYVCGLAGDAVAVALVTSVRVNSFVSARVGIGLDSTTAPTGLSSWKYSANETGGSPHARYGGIPGLGYHYLAWLEKSDGGTTTFYGDSAGDGIQSGLSGEVSG